MHCEEFVIETVRALIVLDLLDTGGGSFLRASGYHVDPEFTVEALHTLLQEDELGIGRKGARHRGGNQRASGLWIVPSQTIIIRFKSKTAGGAVSCKCMELSDLRGLLMHEIIPHGVPPLSSVKKILKLIRLACLRVTCRNPAQRIELKYTKVYANTKMVDSPC